MPILSYFTVVGSVMVALLFLADATLTKSDTPVVATSSLYGMPAKWQPDATPKLASTPAPEPDMASDAVQAAMPKTVPVNERSDRLARAEAAPKKKRVARRPPQPDYYRPQLGYQQNYAYSRGNDPFSGGMFGRF
jgi:hypothetical protein